MQIGNPKVGFQVQSLFSEGLRYTGRQLVSRNHKPCGANAT